MTRNVLLAGVGGQGTILASTLMTIGLMRAGYDVKMSEIHGMSQRGGSVSSQIRYGDAVNSPVIEPGGADLLVAFEKMEALRWLPYLKPGGNVIVNDCQINPVSVATGVAVYPPNICAELAARVPTYVFHAAEEAEKLGNPKVTNVLLLGAVVRTMGLEHIDWDAIIRETVKPAYAEVNVLAFKRGMELIG